MRIVEEILTKFKRNFEDNVSRFDKGWFGAMAKIMDPTKKDLHLSLD